jgi:hypothetical protein
VSSLPDHDLVASVCDGAYSTWNVVARFGTKRAQTLVMRGFFSVLLYFNGLFFCCQPAVRSELRVLVHIIASLSMKQ